MTTQWAVLIGFSILAIVAVAYIIVLLREDHQRPNSDRGMQDRGPEAAPAVGAASGTASDEANVPDEQAEDEQDDDPLEVFKKELQLRRAAGAPTVMCLTQALDAAGSESDVEYDEMIRICREAAIPDDDIMVALYQVFNSNLKEVIDIWPDALEPEHIGQLAKLCQVDLGKDELYSSLREEGMDFEDAVKMVRAAGGGALAALGCEVDFSSFDDDAFSDIIKMMVGAGYTAKEVMDAVASGEVDLPYDAADIIEVALDPEFPGFDWGAYLDSQEPDPDQLDEDLRELDVEIKDRVAVLHRLLFPESYMKTPAQGESAPSEAAVVASPAPSGTDVHAGLPADGLPCPDCGTVMVRCGECQKCMNCGHASGCS